MHKSQVFLYLLLAFIAGVGVGSFLVLGTIVPFVLFAIGVLGVVLFWRRQWPVVIAGCVLIAFVVGVWQIQTAQLNQGILTQLVPIGSTDRGSSIPQPNKNLGGIGTNGSVKITLNGYIADEPQPSGDQQKLILQVKDYSLPGYANFTDEKVLLTTTLFPRYYYRQQISVTGILHIPDFQDGEFDYRNYLAKDGIFTTMSYPKVQPADINLSFWEKLKLPLFSRIFTIKNMFEKAVEHAVPEPNASYINGILLGSKTQIPQDLKNAFARTSTSHILAISGYNITIIAEIISMILLLFLRRSTAFWFSLLAIAVFTIMTGAQSAVIRAAIMGMLVLLARREGRFYNVQNAIVFAAAIMIYLNPMVLRYDVGFQLSFVATMGLVFLSQKMEKQFKNFPDKFKIRETLVMSTSAQIFVLPLLLYYFKSLSLVSLPANLLVLPTIPYAMLLGFVTGIVGMFWPFAGQLIGYLTWLLSAVEIGIIRFLAAPSFVALNVSLHWSLVVLAYVALASYIYYDSKNRPA